MVGWLVGCLYGRWFGTMFAMARGFGRCLNGGWVGRMFEC